MSHASPTTRTACAGAGAVMLCACMPALPASASEAGQTDEAYETSLAMQLSNPVAALISVPLQLNYDQDIGPADDGDRWLLNVQPVIPFDLNDDWNLISRTILPVVRQSDIFPGAGTQTGMGDVVQSIFFSPKAPTASGLDLGRRSGAAAADRLERPADDRQVGRGPDGGGAQAIERLDARRARQPHLVVRG